VELRIGSSDRLRIVSRPGRLTIEVRGLLDAVVVKAMAAVLASLDRRAVRVEIDLDSLAGHTDDGIAALPGLAESGCDLTYTATSAPGRAALLASAFAGPAT
jgi:hypothetical protein